MMELPYAYAQEIGFIGAAIGIARYQFKQAHHIKLLGGMAALVFALHYFLLDGFVGCFISVLVGIRSILFSTEFGMNHRRYIVPSVLAITSIYGLFYGEDLADLLLVTSLFIDTFTDAQKDAWRVRIGFLIPPPIWFFYNALHGSYGGMITNTIVFISGLVGMYRHHYCTGKKA